MIESITYWFMVSKEEKDEKINERIYDFMVNDLNIEKKRADSYT